MLAGLWRQHEMKDGTYTMWDLVEVNRILDVREENERRRDEAIRRQQEPKGRRR